MERPRLRESGGLFRWELGDVVRSGWWSRSYDAYQELLGLEKKDRAATRALLDGGSLPTQEPAAKAEPLDEFSANILDLSSPNREKPKLVHRNGVYRYESAGKPVSGWHETSRRAWGEMIDKAKWVGTIHREETAAGEQPDRVWFDRDGAWLPLGVDAAMIEPLQRAYGKVFLRVMRFAAGEMGKLGDAQRDDLLRYAATLCEEATGLSEREATVIAGDMIKAVIRARKGSEEKSAAAAVERATRLARDVVLPPWSSPSNIEVRVMGAERFKGFNGIGSGEHYHSNLRAIKEASEDNRGLKLLLDSVQQVEEFLGAAASGEWLVGWEQSAFARLEVGHILAASLCLTDAPRDLLVRAPWPAWSLVMPDRLLGEIARVWCLGAEPIAVIEHANVKNLVPFAALSEVDQQLVTNLVRGVCLAISEPNDFKKSTSKANNSGRRRKRGAPDFEQARFVLSAPVSIDLREHLAEARSTGRRSAVPKVQFLVRGHWRQQAHGAGRSMRKTIWIQPFWKGPEEGRVLLRSHEVDD